jgi:hypothetical protein
VSRIVALEGNSGVGKSTVAAGLAASLGSAASVPEYGDYIQREPTVCLPEFPPCCVASVARTNEIWPAIDLRRQADLDRLGRVAET